MKIFPPFREMLWSVGRSTFGLVRAHRYVVVAAVALLSCGLLWGTMTNSTSPTGANNNASNQVTASLTIVGTSCSSLQADQATLETALHPCSRFKMKPGLSIARDQALTRTALPPRTNQLTASDRAITPPGFRTSVFGQQPTNQLLNQPSLALSPVFNE